MIRRLTLRARLALLIALAVAVAVAACATLSWFLVKSQLYEELDRRLRVTSNRPPGDGRLRGDLLSAQVEQALNDCTQKPTTTGTRFGPPPGFSFMQVLKADGAPCTIPDNGALTVTQQDIKVARGELKQAVHDGVGITTTDGAESPVRIITVHRAGGAVSYALPVDQVEGPLGRLALMLISVSALGVLVSAGAGLAIARASLKPVDHLTDVVEHIARTEDLDTAIPIDGKDEIARLSRSFNAMTRALASSRDHQQRLIADAGHELRTPLTSMRTNIDLLMRSEATGRALPPETRAKLLVSVKAQMLELSSLVGDLLELARQDETAKPKQVVALHEVVGNAVGRARLRGLGLRIEVSAEPWYVHGDPGSLERAVVNLLDNAVKFSPPAGTVEVYLRKGELTVRDHGPGIPEEELPHVFERFWRSPSARSMPGSGLGLSIVHRVAGESGGEVRLERAPGGGTIAFLALPGASR
ncbi:MAG: two-component system, OmpR family, sensor histidine kinase MprB [Streptosporangiaceae bacterium]|nr:histidine kinase [Streptosporangiaceae bacterium]MDX6428677.1 two-component system, OmpR family, sensor histidine kinase MprB [Streptosporangiaceae bacterium]